MIKEQLYTSINEKYEQLKAAMDGMDLRKIKELSLELHAMVHPAEVSSRLNCYSKFVTVQPLADCYGRHPY